MKSLHLVKTSTGATWAFRVMRDLVAMGDEVHVAMPIDGPLVPQYKACGIIVHEFNYSARTIVKTLKNLSSLIEEIQPEIVHSHFVLTTIIMRLANYKKRIPRVFEVPGPLHLEHTIFRKIDICTAKRKVDYWIPTCQWSYDTYCKCGISKDRLFLTYYGNDLSFKEFPSGKLREELHLAQDDIIVGMVAYMYAPKKFLGQKRGLKGHEDLIDAIALIQDKYPNLHLVFIGGPWDGATEYEQQVIAYGKRKCKRVHFLGTRNNVPELYQDFNMVVHPSHTENLGGAGESLLLGIPTIATKVGGFPDIVIPGKTGYLVPPYHPQSIADAIEDVIAHPKEAKEMALYGQKHVGMILDAKRTSKDVYNFYRQIQDHFKKANKTN